MIFASGCAGNDKAMMCLLLCDLEAEGKQIVKIKIAKIAMKQMAEDL